MFSDLIAPSTALPELADGWLLQDAEGTIVAVEAPDDTLYGWREDELRSTAGPQMVHPDDRQVARKLRDLVRTDGRERGLQLRARSQNGRWLWVDCRFRAAVGLTVSREKFTIAALRDVSAAHLEGEVLSLVVELRALVSAATNLDDAWSLVLERIGRLVGCRAVLAWEATQDSARVRHSWAGDPKTERLVSWRRSITCTDRTTSALGRAWTSGEPTNVAEIANVCTGHDPDAESSQFSARLIPVTSNSETLSVVELVHDGEAIGDDMATLVDTVVAQLGDTLFRRHLQHELSVAERQFRLTFEAASIGMGLAASDGTFLRANDSFCQFLGRSEDELRELGFQQVTHPDDLPRDRERFAEMVAGTRDSYQVEKRYLYADGSTRWGLLAAVLVRDLDGTPLHFVFQVHDIDARKTAERQLHQAIARFRAAFDDSGVGMALVRLDDAEAGHIIEANEAFASIARLSLDELRLRTIATVFDAADVERVLHDLAASDADVTEALRDEFEVRRPDGTPIWVRIVASPVDDAGADGILAIFHIEDVTEQRKAQDQLAHIALHDSLTGLPNRALITDRIRMAQERSERNGNHLGVLFIDLDKFKDVNDSLGHDIGDQLLECVAERFRHTLRHSDTAARIGGDEFVVLCDELSSEAAVAAEELEHVARRLHQALIDPIAIDEREVFVTASIGMNVIRGSEDDVRTTLSNADIAMYRAKARGRSRSEPYDEAVRREAHDRLRLSSELHHAIERNQINVAYQPIVELATGAVRGAEALIRWHHPELGYVSPIDMISIAEDSDLIVNVGDFVIDHVCGRLQTEHRGTDFYVTANVSARQLSRSDFAETVTRYLSAYGLEPQRLAVELTENVLMDAGGSSLAQLNDLHRLGVRVGVDDFGTGYASLTYLKQLPVSFVKIDRSFIDGLSTDDHDRTITTAVVQLASALDLDVIAEGVETVEQAEILADLGCRHAQGYHFGRPV